MSEILSLEGKGVGERVSCKARRSEMEEGRYVVLKLLVRISERILYCMRCSILSQ